MGFWRRLVGGLAVACSLAGATVSVWPVAEAAFAQYSNARVAASSSMPDSGAAGAAEEYNAAKPPVSATDPWSDDAAATGPDHDRYLAALGGGDGPIGRVEIPTIGVDLPIWPDATKTSLAKGAGHMYGTSLPVGGPGTHAVIAAHTGMTNRVFFDRLPELGVGDVFFVDSAAGRLAYRVDETAVVSPDDLSRIQPIPGEDHVTLITCTDYRGGHAARRLLVRGIRTSLPEQATATLPAPVDAVATVATVDWAWPRLAVGAAGLLVAGLLVSQDRRPPARRRR